MLRRGFGLGRELLLLGLFPLLRVCVGHCCGCSWGDFLLFLCFFFGIVLLTGTTNLFAFFRLHQRNIALYSYNDKNTLTTLLQHSPPLKKFFSQFLRHVVSGLLSFGNCDRGIILVASRKRVVVSSSTWLGTGLTEQSRLRNDFIKVVFIGLFILDGTGGVLADLHIGPELLGLVAFGAVVLGEVVRVGHCDAVAVVTV